jgi:hypothetical protein
LLAGRQVKRADVTIIFSEINLAFNKFFQKLALCFKISGHCKGPLLIKEKDPFSENKDLPMKLFDASGSAWIYYLCSRVGLDSPLPNPA